MTPRKPWRPKINRRLRDLQKRETRWLDKLERAKATKQSGDTWRCADRLGRVRDEIRQLNREEGVK